MTVALDKLDMPPLNTRISQTGKGSDAQSISKMNQRALEKNVSGNTSQMGGNTFSNPMGPKDKRRKKLMDFY